MLKYLLGLILVLQLTNSAFGHLCLFDPPQRNPNWAVPIDSGDNACFRVRGNCGNVTSGAPVAIYNAGSTINVFFQQNYNHWYAENPGFLDISISYDGDNGDFTLLSPQIDDYNAWDMVTQTNYTVPVSLPNKPCKNCVLRVRYICNNPAEPNFTQCSDIAII
ncbi:hypothetical protein DICPUDRAFT_95923 [Dictyostelium purpureum]|uniref:Chitin-binding type-4 domain-containing protein n=1 Tax=Dictyostelium purpureum TaxID=5786 RepID=F1A2P2_DICPU|nr:uncharacterized protein DICPUDRAFT_95923 [Dictyostelium purpureum]EGC29539.1 hypothetical protein DICPUDRAFT_95923 [Dictyostelium purpureum]|eukprot:XP_003293929.1 hypothetical protein DICPUDRAFT_95923 [Dictyostelium purpureum]